MIELFNPEYLVNLILEVLIVLTPIFIIFVVFQLFILKLPRSYFFNTLKGFFLTFIGLILFLYGVQIGFMPAGYVIGATLALSRHRWLLVPIGFLLGFVVTIVEPSVRIICIEVEKSTSGYIKEKQIFYILSLGVSVAVALAMAKILFEIPLLYILLPGYILVFALSYIAGPKFTALSFDSGGVATGPMTVSFLLSISIGAAGIFEGMDVVLHGFGLVAIASLAPIIAVLVFGMIFQRKTGFLKK